MIFSNLLSFLDTFYTFFQLFFSLCARNNNVTQRKLIWPTNLLSVIHAAILSDAYSGHSQRPLPDLPFGYRKNILLCVLVTTSRCLTTASFDSTAKLARLWSYKYLCSRQPHPLVRVVSLSFILRAIWSDWRVCSDEIIYCSPCFLSCGIYIFSFALKTPFPWDCCP